eukprot:CFRG7931T1
MTTTEGSLKEVSSTQSFHSIFRVVVIGTALRILLFVSGYHDTVATRLELVTPITSFKRAREGLFLAENELSPYSGDTLHQSPLVLALVWLSTLCLGEVGPIVLSIVIDCLFACALMYTWRTHWAWLDLQKKNMVGRTPKVLQRDPETCETYPTIAAAFYMFSPYTLLTCVALSTGMLGNVMNLAAFAFALHGWTAVTTLCIAVATCLSPYSVILLPAAYLIVDASKKKKSNNSSTSVTSVATVLVMFGVWLISLLLKASDLSPNVGLYWYYFLEIFDQFRDFFLCVFNFQLLLSAIPLTVRFRDHPTVLFTALVGLVGIHKSYPTVADTSLTLWFLTLWPHLFPYMRYRFIICCMLITTSILGPIFFNGWVWTGSGNANFFYAITLVHSVANILCVIDLLNSHCRREFDLAMGVLSPMQNVDIRLI